MITFFKASDDIIYAVLTKKSFDQQTLKKLSWLFGDANPADDKKLTGGYTGPRKEMITPWSTNAVEITQNMGIKGITRIEEFVPSKSEKPEHDPMLQSIYR